MPAPSTNPRQAVADLLESELTSQETGNQQTLETEAPATPNETLETGDHPLDTPLETGQQDQDTTLETSDAVVGDQNQVETPGDPEKLPETVSEFADFLDIPADVLYGLKMSMPDGEDPVTIGDLKDQIRNGPVQQAELEQLAAQKDDFVQQQKQFELYQETHAKFAPQIYGAQARMDEIKEDWGKINWAEFEKKDPAKAILQRDKMKEAYGMASAQAKQATEQMEQAAVTYHQEVLDREWAKVVEKRPEWKNPETAKSGMATLLDAGKSIGFSEQELNMITDHRFFDALELISKALSAKKIDIKKVRDSAQSLRSGKPTEKAEVEERNRQSLLSAAAKETNFRKKAALLARANVI